MPLLSPPPDPKVDRLPQGGGRPFARKGRSAERGSAVTIDQVAARAGVSPGTVSRVLNGKNKENRPAIALRSERIRRIATELGYRPNAAARSMLRGTFRAVSFVTCGDVGSDWYPISGLNGIHTILDRHAWRLVFNELPAKVLTDPELVPNLFRETAVDGLLINLVPAFTSEVAEFFESQPLPCVWLNLKRRHRSVYPDEATGMALGVSWLLQRGHQRIGFFSRLFSPPTHYSVTDRFDRFMHEMNSRQLSPHRRLEIMTCGDPKALPLLDRAKLYLKTFPDLQAVICYELEEAICIRVAADSMGRGPGNELQIIGYSEREIQVTSGLDIPTLVVPFHEMGRRAVEVLEQMIETNQKDVPSVAVPFQSIVS